MSYKNVQIQSIKAKNLINHFHEQVNHRCHVELKLTIFDILKH